MSSALVFIGLVALLSLVLAMSHHTSELSTLELVLRTILEAAALVWVLMQVGVL